MVSREIHINGVKYRSNGNKLYLTLGDNSNVNIIDISHFINRYNSKDIDISNFTNSKALVDTFKVIKSLKVDGEIVIDLNSFINNHSYIVKNLIMGFNNRTYIDLNNIPSNVKLYCFNKNHRQNEFTTWAHNLNTDNKKKLYKILSNEDKRLFLDEERVISSFFSKIISIYPNILEMPKKEAFNTIYEYFSKEYPYAYECTYNGHLIRENSEWSIDPVETYNKGRGICEGRSNLLTLVTNNNLLRLNCTVVDGAYGSTLHTWNQFIDENKQVSDYDLSTSIRDCNSIKEMKEKYNHRYDRVYPCVIEAKKSRIEEVRPLPGKKLQKINKIQVD